MHPEIGTVFAAAMIVGIPKTALRPLEILIPPRVCHLICCNVSSYLTCTTKINKYISFILFLIMYCTPVYLVQVWFNFDFKNQK